MSSSIQINATESGFALAGELKFANAQAALSQAQREFEKLAKPAAGSVLELDLSELHSSDSAGLALLLKWRRDLMERGHQVSMVVDPIFSD